VKISACLKIILFLSNLPFNMVCNNLRKNSLCIL
jgi:hypothetical protein